MYIDILLYYKIKINPKLVKLLEMGCLLSVYPEVIRSVIGRLEVAIGKEPRIESGRVIFQESDLLIKGFAFPPPYYKYRQDGQFSPFMSTYIHM